MIPVLDVLISVIRAETASVREPRLFLCIGNLLLLEELFFWQLAICFPGVIFDRTGPLAPRELSVYRTDHFWE